MAIVLPGRIAKLELMVKELLTELEEIKNLVRSLELENEKLRHELIEMYNQQNKVPGNKSKITNDNEPSTLLRLYDEGFHICNVKFAQSRQEECLFCLSLLRRQDSEVGEN